MTEKSVIKVVLADDHRLLRQGLLSLLEPEPGIEVVGEAANGREALELACSEAPDVVVTDIGMPDANGAVATRKILEATQNTRILALSAHSERRYVARMLEAGASGYLTKDCAVDELVEAIQIVHAGNTYLSPSVADTVVKEYLLQRYPDEKSPSQALTEREREILQVLAEGKTTRMIARNLEISPKTVASHRRNIMDKLECNSIAELVKYAVRHGVTDVHF
jgi:DNA-binding NarL/FixJ family response regulator